MSTLLQKVTAIKLDKDTNLIPENLKQGITCLGVAGTFAGGVPLPGEEVTVNALTDIYEGDKVTGILATKQYPKEFKYVPTQSETYGGIIPNSDGSVMVNIRSGTSKMYFSFVGATGYTEQTVSTRFV